MECEKWDLEKETDRLREDLSTAKREKKTAEDEMKKGDDKVSGLESQVEKLVDGKLSLAAELNEASKQYSTYVT